MKKLLFLSAMIIFFSSTSMVAQENMKRENAEKIQEKRKQFYERELQFSEAESKVFWPIFEKHQEKMEQFNNKRNRPKLELMSDAQIESHLDDHWESEEQKLATRKELVQSLRGKIGVRKIAALPQTERKFKKELLRHVRGERSGDGQGRRGPRNGENKRFR